MPIVQHKYSAPGYLLKIDESIYSYINSYIIFTAALFIIYKTENHPNVYQEEKIYHAPNRIYSTMKINEVLQ